MLDELVGIQLMEGQIQFLPGVHHDGSSPGDGLPKRFGRKEEESNPLFPCLDLELVPISE